MTLPQVRGAQTLTRHAIVCVQVQEEYGEKLKLVQINTDENQVCVCLSPSPSPSLPLPLPLSLALSLSLSLSLSLYIDRRTDRYMDIRSPNP